MSFSTDRGRFVEWLTERVIRDARGDDLSVLSGRPEKQLWLGRIAPKDAAWQIALGERGRRLDPCSIGIRFMPAQWSWTASVSFSLWDRDEEVDPPVWRKTVPLETEVSMTVPAAPTVEPIRFGEKELREISNSGGGGKRRQVYFEVEVEEERGGLVASVSLVNGGDDYRSNFDPNLYEAQFELAVGPVEEIELDALPDSFRYDRRIPAYGLYCDVEYDREAGVLQTRDVSSVERWRPSYWDDELGSEPDLRFETLAHDPLESLNAMAEAFERWGQENWSAATLDRRADSEGWTAEMRGEANREAARFSHELGRIREGIAALEEPTINNAFRLTNKAFMHSGRGRYESWRPFQIAFLLTVLPSLLDSDHPDRETVDTLWFATGGGKTETYLAAVVLTCLYDRLRGKARGISAWSRFPLRMLSLQQTQRFADALAGAELARLEHGIPGDPIAVGFFVGGIPNGTPNRIRDDPPEGTGDAGDRKMPSRHQVLLACPFCRSEKLEMQFDRRSWRLMHVCGNHDCQWKEGGLPFYVVDEEIYRFLPSVVIGTLDKAASISMQAAARGLYASPIGECEREGHGFTYAPRRQNPKGCLVPGCAGERKALSQPLELFAPSLRIQDELHLLRDNLGGVDSHYETLIDHLYKATGSPPAKILASSATLAGYHDQAQALYGRQGAMFPIPGPRPGASFWTKDSLEPARLFVGLAPRGVTLDFANDRLAESLQKAVRRLLSEPEVVCEEASIDPVSAPGLIDEYGVHVVYGNKLRDVEAAARSFEQQPGVTPLETATLTGRTPLGEVRDILNRLGEPEADFDHRIHVVCASSMMSHGVDVDRFNVITILGLPLATAEFIQATARIGRRWPGAVFVLHRMGVERDASVFRSFRPFVNHGDRFIEPVAITRRSKRVLEQTFAGLFCARVFGIHEAQRVRREKGNISTAAALREYFLALPVEQSQELKALCDALGIDPDSDDPLESTLEDLLRRTYLELEDPGSSARFVGDVTPSPPMRSLREVETQIPIFSPETT